jgi:NADH-quinone oxidoreductase subunit G
MTAATGHAARRTRFPKRTHLNQDLGPFIKHEMNRCIGCYRCVRFYRDYAGGADFGVFGANRNVYFGRAADGALQSDFAGNLVEVCPTGVFVDKPFSQTFRRRWDMRATPSVCPHCAVGCNITVQEREGRFRRVVNRYNETLNGYFLCDRGRFGTGFIESKRRLRGSRAGGTTLSHEAARGRLTEILRREGVIGIGSARASVEANFLLRRLVGPDNFYAALSDREFAAARMAIAAMRVTPVARLGEAAAADAVVILGDDPFMTAPRLGLALRQAAVRPPAAVLAARDIPAWHDAAARTAGAGHRIPFVIATPAAGALDAVASETHRVSAQGAVGLAVAIRRGVAGEATDEAGARIAAGLLAARNPVIVAGGDAGVVAAAANIVLALRRRGVTARLSLLLAEANSVGLALLDPLPLSAALAACEVLDVIVLEADLHRHAAAGLFAAARSVTVLDHVATASTADADLSVAVGCFADADGIFVNLEGRAQRFYKAIVGVDDPPASWLLLRDAGIAAGRLAPDEFATQDALLAAMGADIPELAGCRDASPMPDTRRPPTLPHRYSGRTAVNAGVNVREPMPPAHDDSPLGTTMEGLARPDISPLIWAPGWNSVQAVHRFQDEIGGALAGAQEVFLFDPPADAADFDIPPVSAPAAVLPEELSALSPAMIARKAAS